MLASFLNSLWGILSIIALLIVLLCLYSLIFRKTPSFIKHIGKHGVIIAFIASLLATIGSLMYSDVLGYEPCKLCWFQRIFMYPQVIILGFMIWKKNKDLYIPSIILSSLGAIIAAYHYVSQIGWNPLDLECASIGYAVSCAKMFTMQFGFITIPFMALSVFLLIVTVLLLDRSCSKQ